MSIASRRKCRRRDDEKGIAPADSLQAFPAPALEEQLQGLLITMERPFVPPGVRARLLRAWHYHGETHVVLTIRTITESEGNEGALIEPIVGAVSGVMQMKPEWPNRGLEWMEAFDRISLVGLLQRFQSLQLFKPETLARYYALSLRNHLWDILEPTPPAAPATAQRSIPQHPHGIRGYDYKRGPRRTTIERLAREKAKANANVMAMPIADGQ